MSPSPSVYQPPTLTDRLTGGAASGLGAALIVGGLDALRSADPVARQFDSLTQRLWFAFLTVLAPALFLMLWGALLGAISHAVVTLSHRAAGGRASAKGQHRFLGLTFALIAAPAIAWVCSQVFSGPRAQQIPGHQLLAVLLFVVAVGGLYGAIQLALAQSERIRGALTQGQRARRALVVIVPAFAVLLVLYAVEQKVLPRLYPWFHLSLQAALVLVAQLLVVWLWGAVPRRQSVIVTLFVAGLFGGGWAMHRLQRAQTLRGLALEHTSVVAQVLRIDGALRGTPRRPPTSPPQTEAATDSDPMTPPSLSGPRLAGRDVFLITVDALRFDRVSAATMPFVSSLLPRAAVFTRAYTQVPHTSFAVATLLTGKPVYALMTLGQDAASHETLPLVLRRFRYKTAAFYPPSVFYVEHERLRRLEESAYGFEYVKFEYLDAPARTTQLINFLEQEQPQRVFAWVHYLEPHEPYDPHPGGPGAARPDHERYDGEVRFVDDQIHRLYDYLQRTRPQALLVLAADHGEEFGEHGGRYHGTSLYEEQVHVPLLIVEVSPAGGTDKSDPAAARLLPQKLDQPVGLIDVAPTILGLLDIEPSVRMRGHDLSPWLLTAQKTLPRWPVFSEIGRKKMVLRGDHKLICDFATDSCQTFDLRTDPLERRNIADSSPTLTTELRGSLDRFIAEARRFEEAPPGSTPTTAAHAEQAAARTAALSRGRMGDRSALPLLVGLLTDAAAAKEQRQAALPVVTQLLAAALPGAVLDPALADPDTRARLRALYADAAGAAPGDVDKDKTQLRWAALLYLRLSLYANDAATADDAAASAVAEALLRDDHADAEQRLAGALILARLPRCAPTRAPAASPAADCTELLLAAVPAAMTLDDPDRVRPLLLLLGSRRDARALATLLSLLESVRCRPDVVKALGLLGDRRAVAAVAELLASDPYVPVRAAAATTLGQLGGPAATLALHRAQASEREPLVRTAIAAALTAR